MRDIDGPTAKEEEADNARPCPECNGQGKVVGDWGTYLVQCPKCGGEE